MMDRNGCARGGVRRWLLLSAAAVTMGLPVHPARAQSAAPPAKGKPAGPLGLESIVVTATARGVSKMKSSVSVSTLSATQIQQSGAVSAADVLRDIPGFRSEASGGDSNANVTVRGLPVSAGGARYVQFQVDGLPVLQFGDIAFATPDSFLRVDDLLQQVQAVRGGSSSTEATNAPGGIVNFINKTGETAFGSAAVTTGLDYDMQRVDFSYGGPIDDVNRFAVGGFYRTGVGVRDAGATVFNGGQVHGNFTHDFDGGFIRLNFGFLNDVTPTLLPVPRAAGIDPRYASFYSKYFGTDPTETIDNSVTAHSIDTGNFAEQKYGGFEFHDRFLGGFILDDKFRYEVNSGRFLGLYPGGNVFSNPTLTYATGPNAGQPYTGRAFDLLTFDTALNNLNNVANDLKLSAPRLDAGELGVFTPVAGFYFGQQQLQLTWDFNLYYATLQNQNAQLLNGSGPDGVTGPDNLLGGIGGGFGHCCERYYDVTYTTTSPYFDVGWQIGNFTSDASVREDVQQASGQVNFSPATTGSSTFNQSAFQPVSYSINHTDYSIGTNYQVDHDLAVFARISNGASFNADRILNPGQPIPGTSVPVPINTVDQYEGGVKWRYNGLNLFLTGFDAHTSEANYDVTTQVNSANTYDAYGAELEFGYDIDAFSITGGATYTHARITKTNETFVTASGQTALDTNHVPQRQADWVFQVSTSYRVGPVLIGATAIGTTSSYATDADQTVMPGYVVVNAFVNYQITPKLDLMFKALNLANQIAYTEFDGATSTAARAIDGRSFSATLRYAF